MLEKLTTCRACKHASMNSSSTLIRSNHFDDLLYFPGIVKHGWLLERSSFFILGCISFLLRQILGEIIEHLQLLRFIRWWQNSRIGSSHTIACLNLPQRFLRSEIYWGRLLGSVEGLGFFLQTWISSWMGWLGIEHLLTQIFYISHSIYSPTQVV